MAHAVDIHLLRDYAPPIVGMAALWMSLYKRLLYPVMYSFQRTGYDGGMTAQGVYALVFVVVLFMLYALRERSARLLLGHRWIPCLFGAGGALGMAMLVSSGFSEIDPVVMFGIGGALVAVYMPVHLAYWAFHTHTANPGNGNRALIGSFALFLVSSILIMQLGGQSSALSIACPAISTLAIACCKPIPRAALPHPADLTGTDDAPVRHVDAIDLPQSPVIPRKRPTAAHEDIDPSRQTASNQPPELASGTEANIEAHDALQQSVTSEAMAASSEKAELPTKAESVSRPAAYSAHQPDTLRAFRQFGKDFGLSERESELAAYAYRNYSARKIAGELFIAESTVYTHLKRIYRKTGVHSKQELIDLMDEWAQRTAVDVPAR